MNRIILSTLLCAGTLVFGQQQNEAPQNNKEHQNANGKADITYASIYNYSLLPQVIDIAKIYNLTPEQGKASVRNSIAGITELALPKLLFSSYQQ